MRFTYQPADKAAKSLFGHLNDIAKRACAATGASSYSIESLDDSGEAYSVRLHRGARPSFPVKEV